MQPETIAENINDAISKAQLEKLKLEIVNLAINRSRGSQIVKYIPILSSLVAVLGFLLGIYSFNSQKEKDYKQEFWNKQLNFYEDLIQTTSRLSTLEPSEERMKTNQHFKELFHGVAILYMDDSVAIEVKRFVELYIDYQSDLTLQTDVQECSRILAQKCRKSLQKNWELPLRDINITRYR
jgi:hypothetical protein